MGYILSPYTHPVRYTTLFLFTHSYSLLLQHHRQHDFLIHLLRGRQSPPHNLPTLLGITGPGLQDQRDRQGSRAPRPQQVLFPSSMISRLWVMILMMRPWTTPAPSLWARPPLL